MRTSDQAITEFLSEYRGQWFDAKTIHAGAFAGMSPPAAYSLGSVRYNLNQMIRTGRFEQRRLKDRGGKKRGAMYEFRMKPEPKLKPIRTVWTEFVDAF